MNAQRDRSEEIAAQLRSETPRLDDVAQARVERRLLDAMAVQNPPRFASWGRRGIVVGFAGGLAAAAIVFLTLRSTETEHRATFEARDGRGVVQVGVLREGDELATSRTEVTVLSVADSRVELAGSTRARVERMTPADLRIRLAEGSVRVEFHPRRRGEERLVVETRRARVEVVGTVFRVTTSAAGHTSVDVEEGVVRVVPLDGGEAQLVRAGERWEARTAVASVAPAGAEPRPSSVVSTPHGTALTDTPAELAAPARRPLPTARAEAEAAEHPEAEPELSPEEEIAAVPEAPLGEARPLSTDRASELGSAASATAVELEEDPRFDLAEVQRRRGDYREARGHLYAILRNNRSRAARARAWTMVAETYAREGEDLPASEAYRRAADEGRATIQGANALFALAMMREHLSQRSGAQLAYRRYLEEFPRGSHADLCRQALCRLGESWYCTAAPAR